MGKKLAVCVMMMLGCGGAKEDPRSAATWKIVQGSVGAEVARPGEVFEGLMPGETRQRGDEVATRIAARIAAAGLTAGKIVDGALVGDVEVGPSSVLGVIDALTVNAVGPACTRLQRTLHATWKRGEQLDEQLDEQEVWLDPVRKVRARLRPGKACRLNFERYATPTEWVAMVAIAGQPADAVRAAGGPAADPSRASDTLIWVGPGVGVGLGVSAMQAAIADGKVEWAEASTFASKATVAEIVASVTKLAGPPAQAPGGDPEVERHEWHTPADIRLTYKHGQVKLRAGKLPD